jgi:hypothetical protein
MRFPGKTVKLPGIPVIDAKGSPNRWHLKYGLELEFGSLNWKKTFGLRNTIEDGNSTVKQADRIALGVVMKRLVRGPWFAVLRAACETIRPIVEWIQERRDLAHRNRKNRSHAFGYAERLHPTGSTADR